MFKQTLRGNAARPTVAVAVLCWLGLFTATASGQPRGAKAKAGGGRAAITSFDEAAREAVSIPLASALWASRETCSSGDDLTARQCKFLRDRVLSQLRAATFVKVNAAAPTVGAWDPQTKSTSVTMSPCIACDGMLLGQAKATVKFALPAGATATSARGFTSNKASVLFGGGAAYLMATEVIVTSASLLAAKGNADITLDAVAYRAVDVCDGWNLAFPGTSSAGGDEAKCQNAKKQIAGLGDFGGADIAEPVVVIKAALEKDDVRAAMTDVADAAQKCFEQFAVPGDAVLRIVVAGSGEVLSMEQTGDFVATPTGACIDEAGKLAKFPPTKRAKTTLKFPLQLR